MGYKEDRSYRLLFTISLNIIQFYVTHL